MSHEHTPLRQITTTSLHCWDVMMDACGFLYPLSYQPETAGTGIRAAILYHPVSVSYSNAKLDFLWSYFPWKWHCEVISQSLGTKLCVLFNVCSIINLMSDLFFCTVFKPPWTTDLLKQMLIWSQLNWNFCNLQIPAGTYYQIKPFTYLHFKAILSNLYQPPLVTK